MTPPRAIPDYSADGSGCCGALVALACSLILGSIVFACLLLVGHT